MIKHFCDKCNNICSRQFDTRRYEHLTHAHADGGIQIGLEIIPIFNGSPNQENCICDNCLLGMLVEIAKVPITESVIINNHIRDLQSIQGNLERKNRALEIKCETVSEELLRSTRVLEEERDTSAKLLTQVKRQNQEMETMRRDFASRLEVRKNLKETV